MIDAAALHPRAVCSTPTRGPAYSIEACTDLLGREANNNNDNSDDNSNNTTREWNVNGIKNPLEDR